MQGRQRSPFDNDRLRKEDSSSLTIGRRARKQVLDLIERKATIFQLGWTAFGNIVHRRADLAQWSKSLIAPPDIRELGTSRDKVVVPQLLPLPAASPRRQDHHLAVAHGLRISQSKDSGRLKLRGKDLGAFADMHRRHDENEDAPGLEPTIRVRQKHPLCTLASSLAPDPIVWRSAERKAAAFDRAVHVEAVAVNHLIDNGGSLFGAMRIQLHPRSEERRVGKECRSRWSPYP